MIDSLISPDGIFGTVAQFLGVLLFMLNDAQTAEFVRLLTAHQPDIYFYIRTLIFQGDQADDVLGDTNLALWASRDSFQIGTNFRAWAFQTARYKVLQWQARRRKETAVFSDDMLRELADFAERQADGPVQRLEDLRHCVQKLPPEDRKLIERRYSSAAAAGEIAAEFSRSKQWFYNAICRIRAALTLCIARRAALRQAENSP